MTGWLRDCGTLERQKNDIDPPFIRIPDPKVRLKEPLTIYQLAITFILLLSGIIASVVVFLSELLKGNGKKEYYPADHCKLQVQNSAGQGSDIIYPSQQFHSKSSFS